MKMIKAVFFDISGVVYINGTKKFIEGLHARHGTDMDILKDLTNGIIGTQYRENKITKNEYWQQFKKLTHISESSEQLEAEWIQGFKVMEATKQIIMSLKKNYKVYYLSDNAKDISLGIAKNPEWNTMFDGGIFAWEAGVRKPSTEIYRLALDHAHVAANKALFIDDKESNLKPAAELGMNTIFFTGSETLKQKLIDLKILS